jgi:PTS system nitrogen regulatory IIA component
MNRSQFSTKELISDKFDDLGSVLTPERVGIIDCNDKESTLRQIIQLLATAPEVKDADELAEGIFRREQLMSTGIGMGIAVPHVRLASVEKPTMAVGISSEGIKDYESLDDSPVHLIFMIAAGKDQHKQYLHLLSAVSRRLKDSRVRGLLINATDGKTFCDILTGSEDS